MKSLPVFRINLKSGENSLVYLIIILLIISISIVLANKAGARPLAAANPALTLSSLLVMIGEDFTLNAIFPGV